MCGKKLFHTIAKNSTGLTVNCDFRKIHHTLLFPNVLMMTMVMCLLTLTIFLVFFISMPVMRMAAMAAHATTVAAMHEKHQ